VYNKSRLKRSSPYKLLIAARLVLREIRGYGGTVRGRGPKFITYHRSPRNVAMLPPGRDLMIFVSAFGLVPFETALSDNDVGAVRLGTASADSFVSARRIASCMFYLRELLHYRSVPGCVYTLIVKI
jgi:hypothetical protein